MSKNIIIVGLLFIILLLITNKCNNIYGDSTNYKDTTITKIDTIKYIDTVNIEKDTLIPIYSIRLKDSTIYNIIDTIKVFDIVDKFYTKNFYDDTLHVDSNLTIRIQENTYMNLVDNRSVMLIRKNSIIKESLIVKDKFKRSLYIGAQISGSDAFLDAGPYIGYIPNKRWIIGGSYGLRQKTLNIHTGYRIY